MPSRNLGTTATGVRATETSAPLGWTLQVVFPPELRRAYPLGDSGPAARDITIGRDPDAHGLVLDHQTISRRHASLTWSAAHQAHAVRDLESRNGTSVDGVDVGDEPQPIVEGSLLRLGDALLIYEPRADADSDDAAGGAAGVSADAIPGQSAAIRRLRALVARTARDPAPVLIAGETGTGKERIAAEIHRLSGRSGKMIAVNCAALSPQLVESQLFGHVKGAFTGAAEAQPGLFRAAHGGTLFLDEIGDLPLDLQPKLLRALQEGEILPVGATQPVRVDVRVVAATHRDLVRAARERTFREDLYARLSIAELQVPPLRARRVDLLDWIDRLHAQWAAARGVAPQPPRFDADTAETLLRFAWPLNLRGLGRLVHELAPAAAARAPLGRSSLPAWIGGGGVAGGDAGPGSRANNDAAPARGTPAPGAAASPAVARGAVPTRAEFVRAFEDLGGRVHALARRFGRDRRQIYRWIEAHGLRDARRS